MRISSVLLLSTGCLLVNGLGVPNIVKRGPAELKGAMVLNNAVVYVSCTISYAAFAAVAAIPNGRKTFPVLPICVALGVPLPASLVGLQTSSTSIASKTSTTYVTSSTTSSISSALSSIPTITFTSTSTSASQADSISSTAASSSSISTITFTSTTSQASSSSSSASSTSTTTVPTSCLAGTYSSTGYSPCLKCSAGSFSSGSALSCSFCDAGTESGIGASICTTCLAGKFTLGSGALCASCNLPLGAFNCNPKTQSTISCSAGYAIRGRNQVCTPCDAGQFSISGDVSCSICNNGMSWSAAQASACIICTKPADNSQVDAACVATTGLPTHCSPGYGIATLGTTCTPCLAGTIQLGGGTICSACSDGMSWSAAQASACITCTKPADNSQVDANCVATTGLPTHCSPGYGIATLGTKCTGCSLGTIQVGGGSICSACNDGSSYSGRRASQCITCLNPSDGSQVDSSCDYQTGFPTHCSIGFGVSDRVPKCVACSAGTQYQFLNECTSCTLVANQDLTCDNLGKVNGCFANFGIGVNSVDGVGSTVCSACSGGFYSVTGATVCELYYNIAVLDAASSASLGFISNFYTTDKPNIYQFAGQSNALLIAPPRSFAASDMPVTLKGSITGSSYSTIGFSIDSTSGDTFSSSSYAFGFFTSSANDETSEYFNQLNDLYNADPSAHSKSETNIFNIGAADSNGFRLTISVVDSTGFNVDVTYILNGAHNGYNYLYATSAGAFATQGAKVHLYLVPAQ